MAKVRLTSEPAPAALRAPPRHLGPPYSPHSPPHHLCLSVLNPSLAPPSSPVWGLNQLIHGTDICEALASLSCSAFWNILRTGCPQRLPVGFELPTSVGGLLDSAVWLTSFLPSHASQLYQRTRLKNVFLRIPVPGYISGQCNLKHRLFVFTLVFCIKSHFYENKKDILYKKKAKYLIFCHLKLIIIISPIFPNLFFNSRKD